MDHVINNGVFKEGLDNANEIGASEMCITYMNGYTGKKNKIETGEYF